MTSLASGAEKGKRGEQESKSKEGHEEYGTVHVTSKNYTLPSKNFPLESWVVLTAQFTMSDFFFIIIFMACYEQNLNTGAKN